jgi:bifunctional DNA-binding transcriptional regulator/antitoxin component of YhaV-PrlF toxin-antitoxin module
MGMRTLVAAILAALALATPAGAATRLASVDQTEGGVAFAGADLLYGERTGYYADEGDVIVHAVRPGRRPRVISRERRRGDDFEPFGMEVAFAGSASGVLIARTDSREEEYDENATETVYSKWRLRGIEAGSGRRWQADACTLGDETSGLRPAVSGDAFLAAESGCKEGSLAVRLFSRRGAIVQVFRGVRYGSFDLAGAFATYTDSSGAVVVNDWREGRVVYSVPAPARPATYDTRLFDDGTLVVASDTRYGCEGRIATASPADPVLRELPVRFCTGPVAVAGDRIAFLRRQGEDFELVTVDRSGGDIRPVARFGDLETLKGIALRPDRVAWEVTRCGDQLIAQSGLRPTRAEPAPATSCPSAVARREVKVSARGRLAIPIRCRIGCRISNGILKFVKETDAHSGYVSTRGGTVTLPFEIDRETLGRLRRHGGLRAVLSYSLDLPAAEKQRDVPVVLRP